MHRPYETLTHWALAAHVDRVRCDPRGPHSRRPSKVNWWALVIPAGMVLGAPLLWALLQILIAWTRTL